MAGRRRNSTSQSAASQEEDREELHRRALRRGMAASGIGHLVLAFSLAFAPAPSARPLPAVVNVELMAGLPKPAARRPAPPKPAPAPTPPAAAKPKPPPPPAPAKRVLPKEPAPIRKQPRKVVKPPPKPEKLDYEDALSKLRDEVGEPQEPVPEAEPEVAQPETEGSSGGAGVPVPPEVLRWINQVKRHVRSTYVTPPEFLNRRLETCMTVFLSSDGRLMGEPTVTRSSGGIFWDDNAVRAMVRASPLPAPPGDGGDWQVCYPSEERE